MRQSKTSALWCLDSGNLLMNYLLNIQYGKERKWWRIEDWFLGLTPKPKISPPPCFLKQEILCIALDVLEFTLDTCRPGWPPVQKLACFCLPRQYATTTRPTLILLELWDYLKTHKLADFSGLSGISFYTAFETMHSHEPRPLQKSRYWELWSQKFMRGCPMAVPIPRPLLLLGAVIFTQSQFCTFMALEEP